MIAVLMGSKHAGKDTFASGMTRKYNWKTYAFADAVRAEILVTLQSLNKVMNNTLIHYLQVPDMKESPIPGIGISGRALMQNWGSYRRLQNPNHWVAQVLTLMKKSFDNDPTTKVIVTDCRYENELEALKKFAATYNSIPISVIRISRDGYDGDSHESEDFAKSSKIVPDYEITNEGTVLDLVEKGEGLSSLLVAEHKAGTLI